MRVSIGAAVAMLSATALAGSATTALSAIGSEGGAHRDQGRGMLLDSSLAPSVPSDPMLNEVAAGQVPWMLRDGEARLHRDGRFRVRIRGLVIPSLGTPGPVMNVSASLYCGEAMAPVGTTPSRAISSSGDAVLEGHLTLPAKCLAPVVLIHPNGNLAAYISASGFGG